MKLLFISLGCDKNRVDSEKMLGILAGGGWELTDDEHEADVIIVNTCSFIADAKEESIETLIRMGEMKTEGRCRLLVACGCLPERYRDEFFAELPEVDCMVGTTAWDTIADVINSSLNTGDRAESFADIDALPACREPRVLSTGGHYAYLKIAEGCGKNCTYCAIPLLRGSYRSVPEEDLLKEAEALAEEGVRELILVAQETTLYGTDIYGEKRLPELLHELALIDGIHWIRLLYCYPEEIDERLIQTIKSEEKVCNYIDMPIQHVSDRILRRMGRAATGGSIRRLVDRLRQEIPDIAIRTTLLTGFPGETEEEFEELCDFIKEERFDRLGVFAYSQEEGTPAARMEGQLPDEIKNARRDRLLEIQSEVSLERGRRMMGRTLEVFVEGTIPDEGSAVGRSYRDAPDVDGYVFFPSSDVWSGQFVNVGITGASEYDLTGDMI